MNSKYSLGVVIPIYNVEKYLQECLDSVINQTIHFDEVILVNDGSSDGSRDICEKYCKKHSGFQLIHQENQGLGAARNRGMKESKGDYLIFLDSDDYLNPQTSEVIRKNLSGQDVLFYASEIKDEIEGIIHSNCYIRDKKFCNCVMNGLEYFYHSYFENYIVSSCMAAYKNVFLKQNHIQFPKALYYEDNYFYMELILNAQKVECISDSLYVRRYRENSITMGKTDRKRCLDRMKIQTITWDYIREHSYVKWNKEILCNYLLRGIEEVIWAVNQCDEIMDIRKYQIEFFEKFLEYWGMIYSCDLLSMSNCFVFTQMYQVLSEINSEYLFKLKKVKLLLLEKMKEKLYKLGFGDEKFKVGIYGMGNHTEAMIALYEKYIGKIKCEHFYIVTEIGQSVSNDKKEKREIVTCKNIPKDTDRIILSSRIHMNKMFDNLMQAGIEPNRIYQLYKNDENLDLVMVYDFLKSEM